MMVVTVQYCNASIPAAEDDEEIQENPARRMD
jgi:hypothetical protein